jgi:hypothetical protein
VHELIPSYDSEAGILSATSAMQCNWMFGFNIDGCLVFDLDKNKILVNVDCLIPKKRWKRRDQVWPSNNAKKGRVQFNVGQGQNSIGKSVDCTFTDVVFVCSSHDKKIIYIQIGSEIGSEFLELSRNCLVTMSDNKLTGFWMRI